GVSARWSRTDAGVRLRGGGRWVSRDDTAIDSVSRADAVRARLSVRVVRHPGPGGAVVGGADLHPPSTRLRPPHHALAANQPALSADQPPGPAGGVARRQSVGGAGTAHGERWLPPGVGAGAGEEHHGLALVRGRADAVRAAVPGRRRGAYRAAYRGEGH